MTDQPKELPDSQFVIAKCPGCGAVEFGALHPTGADDPEIDQCKARGLVIEYHSLSNLTELRPILEKCACESWQARAESLEAALRSVLAKVNDLPPSHVSHYQDDIADINDLAKQALGESGVGE